MNFARLPSELAENIFKKCQFKTISKLMQTNSNVNTIIRRNNLDKLDVDEIRFCLYNYQQFIEVIITDCPELGYFERCYAGNGSFYINRILQQVLNTIKSARIINLSFLVLDRLIIRVLNEFSNIFKDVSVEIDRCKYEIPHTDFLPFWKIFKTVLNDDCKFKQNLDEVLTDEMMLQTLPNITFNTSDYARTTHLTDKTLEILENKRPPTFYLCNCTTSYTLDGIKQLFSTIVRSREPSVNNWIIGRVSINYDVLLQELMKLKTEYSNITLTRIGGGHALKIEYKKEGTDATGILAVEVMEE